MADTPYTLNPVQTINPYQDIQTYDPNALQNIESGYGTVQGNLNAINQYKTQQHNQLGEISQQQINIQNQIEHIDRESTSLSQQRNNNIDIIRQHTYKINDIGNIHTIRDQTANDAINRNRQILQRQEQLFSQKNNLQSQLATLKSTYGDTTAIANNLSNIDTTTAGDLSTQYENQNMIKVNRENYMQALRNTARKQGVYGQSNPYLKGLN